MVYDNKVQGIRVLEKKVVTSLLQKEKIQTKQKTKASKSFGIPLCKQAKKRTKTNEQGKVWVPICFRFT